MSAFIIWVLSMLIISLVCWMIEILHKEIKSARYRMHIEKDKFIPWSEETQKKNTGKWILLLFNEKTGLDI